MDYLQFLITGLVKLWTDETLNFLVPKVQRWKDIQTGWTESSPAINAVIWALGIVLAGVITFAVINARREKAKRLERERIYFERKAVEKELEQKHINLLSEAIKLTGISQPYRVLDSFDIFQHLIQRYESKQKFSEQESGYFKQLVGEIKDKVGFNKIEKTLQLGSTRDIQKDQPVKIIVKKKDQVLEYPSTVIETKSDQLILDSSKIDLDFLGLDLNTKIDVNFYRESDAGYSLSTTLSARPNREKNLLYLKHPAKMDRVQARSFSRMEVHFRFSFYHIPKDKFNKVEIDHNLDKCENLPVFAGDTDDISGGGLAFRTQKKTAKGDFLYLNFQMLSDEHTEPLLSEVVWSHKGKEDKGYMVRAKFYHITDNMQDGLMKFIYQMQRRFARRLKFAPKR